MILLEDILFAYETDCDFSEGNLVIVSLPWPLLTCLNATCNCKMQGTLSLHLHIKFKDGA